ncbi:MAG: 2,4'-dihydroxyacetophenone dioxygenase family protein [Rhodospirillales bacterium]
MASTDFAEIALTIALPPEAKRELVTHTADDDERYWVPRGDNVWFRPLLFNVTQGSWVNITKASKQGVIGRHRHPAPVTGFTLEGCWGYLEHDWTAKPGTMVYEPAGETHTLIVKPEPGHMKTLFHNFGPLIMVDETGTQTGFEDVFTRLERTKQHYTEVGLGADALERLIR